MSRPRKNPFVEGVSYARVARILGCTRGQAEEIVLAMDRDVDTGLEKANKLLDGYGIESIRAEGAWDKYFGDIAALYVNMGDPYVGTALYDVDANRWWIGGWGDWLEEVEAKGRYEATKMGGLRWLKDA